MKKKILIVIDNNLSVGGVQEVIMSIVRLLKDEFVFDIILSNDTPGFFDEEFKKQGSIFVLNFKKHPSMFEYFKNKSRIYKGSLKIMKESNYSAVYCSNMFNSGLFLKAAKKCNIPNRIMHCQIGPEVNEKFKSKLLHFIPGIMLRKYSTQRLAVTPFSGSYLFKKRDFAVIKNPIIDTEKFIELGKKAKESVGKIRIVQVGTIIPRKNVSFSLEIAKNLKEITPNFNLTVIGDGIESLKHDLIEKTKILGLESNVDLRFGYTPIEEIFSSFDYLLLPSLGEGLPCVMLEAQFSGMHCFVSNNIEKISDLGNCTYIDLKQGPEHWAKMIFNHYKENGTKRVIIDCNSWDQKNIIKEFREIFNR